MDRILLLDLYFLIYRAQVAFKSTTKDIDTRYVAVFNFFRSLRVLVEQFQPHKIFALLEGNPQFRKDIYADYKANRIIKLAAKTPEQAERFQFSKREILNSLKHLPITSVRHPDYEADDLALTLAADLQGEDITIITNDNDYLQIPQRGYKVKIYNPIKKEYLTPPKYPILAAKALYGDKSDNLKGLMGEKAAIKLLNDPTAFAQWMQQEENRSLFNINKSLIELRLVPADELSFEEGITNFPLLRQEFERMSFASLIEQDAWMQFAKTFDCVKY